MSGRCLLVIPWGLQHIGGVNQVVNNLSLQFYDADPGSVLILISEFGFDRVERQVQDNGVPLAHLTIREPRASGRGWREPLSFLRHLPRTICRLRQLMRDEGITAVNIHYPGLASITLIIAARYWSPRRKVILSFHGADISQIDAAGRLSRAAWRWVLASSANIVTCSRALKGRLASLFPDMNDKIRVVHNGIDSERLLTAATAGRIPTAIEGADYILNAATFEHKKGQDTLISAFAVIAERYPEVKLVMMGRNGDALAGLRQQIAQANLSDRIILFEDVPHGDLLATMANARLFALPSRIEPFGIVLLEAALFRVPVVAASVGGVLEIIDATQDFGLLVPPDDPQAWVTALADCLQDAEAAKERAERLHREVLSRFTWGRAAASYRQLMDLSPDPVRAVGQER